MQNVIKQIVWHNKGDYLATLAFNLQSSNSIFIHSLSKANSIKPFGSTKGAIA